MIALVTGGQWTMLSFITDRFFKSWRIWKINILAWDAEELGTVILISGWPYSYDTLAGGDGEAHQTGAINGHDAIANAQLSRTFCRAAVQQVGYYHSRQDGAPARLHYRDA